MPSFSAMLIYAEYKFSLYSHFWHAADDLEEEDSTEVVPEAEKGPKKIEKKISETFFYNSEDVHSRPFVTEDSGIPINLLTLEYPFCWVKFCRFKAKDFLICVLKIV